jgi:hypothetical protein
MLLDATTPSGTPTVKIDTFKMDSCKIENCMGSMAVRGKVDNPNELVQYSNNLIAFGANGQHASSLVPISNPLDGTLRKQHHHKLCCLLPLRL